MPKMARLLPLLPLLLTACAEPPAPPRVVVTEVPIPASLTAPVDAPAIPEAATQRDVGRLLIDYDTALAVCNGRLAEIRGLSPAGEIRNRHIN